MRSFRFSRKQKSGQSPNCKSDDCPKDYLCLFANKKESPVSKRFFKYALLFGRKLVVNLELCSLKPA